MTTPNTPAGFATVNPFIITRDADGLIGFVTEVFGGIDHPDARTMDDDGLLRVCQELCGWGRRDLHGLGPWAGEDHA